MLKNTLPELPSLMIYRQCLYIEATAVTTAEDYIYIRCLEAVVESTMERREASSVHGAAAACAPTLSIWIYLYLAKWSCRGEIKVGTRSMDGWIRSCFKGLSLGSVRQAHEILSLFDLWMLQTIFWLQFTPWPSSFSPLIHACMHASAYQDP